LIVVVEDGVDTHHDAGRRRGRGGGRAWIGCGRVGRKDVDAEGAVSLHEDEADA
jgi:hypothetical protein